MSTLEHVLETLTINANPPPKQSIQYLSQLSKVIDAPGHVTLIEMLNSQNLITLLSSYLQTTIPPQDKLSILRLFTEICFLLEWLINYINVYFHVLANTSSPMVLNCLLTAPCTTSIVACLSEPGLLAENVWFLYLLLTLQTHMCSEHVRHWFILLISVKQEQLSRFFWRRTLSDISFNWFKKSLLHLLLNPFIGTFYTFFDTFFVKLLYTDITSTLRRNLNNCILLAHRIWSLNIMHSIRCFYQSRRILPLSHQ